MRSVKEANLSGKTILVRCEFNVPIKDSRILEDTRIKDSIPTLEFLLKKSGKIILISHLGRPNGWDLNYSLGKILPTLEKYLNLKVKFIPDCLGAQVTQSVKDLRDGEALMLENLR